jgi:hypothetical protein
VALQLVSLGPNGLGLGPLASSFNLKINFNGTATALARPLVPLAPQHHHVTGLVRVHTHTQTLIS